MNMSQFCMQSSLSWLCSDKAKAKHCNTLVGFSAYRPSATSVLGHSWQAAMLRVAMRGAPGLVVVLVDGDCDGPGLRRRDLLPRPGVGEGNCGRSLADS